MCLLAFKSDASLAPGKASSAPEALAGPAQALEVPPAFKYRLDWLILSPFGRNITNREDINERNVKRYVRFCEFWCAYDPSPFWPFQTQFGALLTSKFVSCE